MSWPDQSCKVSLIGSLESWANAGVAARQNAVRVEKGFMVLLPKGADALVPGIIVSHRPDTNIQQEQTSKSTKNNTFTLFWSFLISFCSICSQISKASKEEVCP
jgi:hypothetical protein